MGPVIEFTENGRHRFAKYLGVTHWICIVPSFVCLVSALYIQLIIEDKIGFIENYNGAILPGFLVFAGSFGFFSHILCGKVIFSNRLMEKREKWAKFLLPAVIVTFIIFLLELVGSIMCYVHISDLGESFDKGIRNAMLVYNTDNVKKEELDILQMTYECCGSKSYSEWFTVSWIKPNSDRGNNDVPFSCCNPAVKRPCIHHRIHDNGYHYNYDYRSGLTIHKRGCATKLMEFYENSVLTVIGSIILALSFIQLVSSVAGRILQTAVVDAMESEDPEGISKGYIFTKEKDKGLNDTQTTEESTEPDNTTVETLDITGETDLDITGETPLDDTFDERYIDLGLNGEPTYENLPPANDEEHIYNEGDVEAYLAMRSEMSKGAYEDTPSSQADTDPVYENVPLLKEVRSNKGSFMTLNTTTNSHRRSVPTSSTQVHRHPFPSPTAQHSRTGYYVIDLNSDRGQSPSLKKRSPPFESKLSARYERGNIRSRSVEPQNLSELSPKKTLRWTKPNIQTFKVQPASRTYPRSIYYRSPTKRESPSLYGSTQRLYIRSPERKTTMMTRLRASRVPLHFRDRKSPRKRQSRSNSASPERQTFKSGCSIGCHHGTL